MGWGGLPGVESSSLTAELPGGPAVDSAETSAPPRSSGRAPTASQARGDPAPPGCLGSGPRHPKFPDGQKKHKLKYRLIFVWSEAKERQEAATRERHVAKIRTAIETIVRNLNKYS